jgi:hypothetical protein
MSTELLHLEFYHYPRQGDILFFSNAAKCWVVLAHVGGASYG